MLKMKWNRLLSLVLSVALFLTAAVTLGIAPRTTSASTAAQLVTQLDGWNGGGNGSLYAVADGNTVTVTGTVGYTTPATSQLSMSIDAGVTVLWQANLTSRAGMGAMNITGAGDFAMLSGSITYNNANTCGVYRSGGRMYIMGGTITQSYTTGNGSEPLRLSNTVLRMSAGAVKSENPSSSEVIYAMSNAYIIITGGTVQATSVSNVALNCAGSTSSPCAIVYSSAANITGTKKLVSPSSQGGVIVQLTTTSPLPQANIGTATGITLEASASPAPTIKWVNNNNRADIEAVFSGVTVTIPMQWQITGVTPVISISAQPTATTNLNYGSISGSLSVTASANPSAALSYQWYSNTTNSSSGGTPISGANTSSYTIPTSLSLGAYYYFCEITALGATSARSNVARVNINPVITASVTQSPNPLKVGEAGSITVSYTLASGSYASTISSSEFSVTGIPAGMTASAPSRYSSTVVRVTITGTPTALVSSITAASTVAANQVPGAPVAINVGNTTLGVAMIKGDGAPVSGPPTAQSITVTGITVNALTNAGGTGQAVNYAISQTNGLSGTALDALTWSTNRAFNGLSPDTQYYVYARTASNTSYNAGPAQSAGFKTAAPWSVAVSSTGLDQSFKVGQTMSAGSIVYTITGGTYAAAGSMNLGNFTVSGLPAGLTAGAAVRTSDTVVTIPITGTPTAANGSTATLTYAGSLPAANITGASTAVAPTGTLTIGAIEKGDGAAVHWPGPKFGLFDTPTKDTIQINPVAFLIGNPGSQAVEYAISTAAGVPSEGWQELIAVGGAISFTGLEPDTLYYIFARAKSNANYHAGEATYFDAKTKPGGLRGDANCDGHVNADDAALILRYLAGLTELSPQALENAKVSGGSTVSVSDAAMILRYLAGLISTL
ncbi:MAG: dockerin type I domain-containing protein [Clostridiales bacterium]|nr:dockerin type I domain-containing protein [Clostridiales bacterium]